MPMTVCFPQEVEDLAEFMPVRMNGWQDLATFTKFEDW